MKKKRVVLIITTCTVLIVCGIAAFATLHSSPSSRLLQETTGVNTRVGNYIANLLNRHDISIDSITISQSSGVNERVTDRIAYEVISSDGNQYLLIVTSDGNDFTALLDCDNKVIEGMIDDELFPDYFLLR